MYGYAPTHIHTHTHTHLHTYTHADRPQTQTHTHYHIWIHTYTPTHLHTDTHARYLQVRRLPPQHRKCNIAARDSPSFSRAFVNAAVSWGGAVPRGYENSQELALVILYSAFRHILQHTAICCNTLQHVATHCNMLQHTAICVPLVILYSVFRSAPENV